MMDSANLSNKNYYMIIKTKNSSLKLNKTENFNPLVFFFNFTIVGQQKYKEIKK